MDIKSSCDVELEHKSNAEAKLEESQSVSSSSSPNNDAETAKSAEEPPQLADLMQQIESQQLHQQLVNALLSSGAQPNPGLLAAMVAATKSPNQKWQPQLSNVWQNALNAASQSPASSSSSASSTSNTPQPIHKSQNKPKTNTVKTPNINMTSAALLSSLAASNNSIGSTMQQALNSLYSPQQLLKSASANLSSPSLNKSQSGSQRSLAASNIYQIQNPVSSSSSPTASLHNINQSASNPILSSNNLNFVDENLANSASLSSLQAALASLTLNNPQPNQQDDLNNLLNNQFLLDLFKQDPSQIENVLKCIKKIFIFFFFLIQNFLSIQVSLFRRNKKKQTLIIKINR